MLKELTTIAPKSSCFVGHDKEGVPLMIKLNARHDHNIIIVAKASAGKTALLHTIITSLATFNAQRNIQVMLIAPSTRNLRPMLAIPHILDGIASNIEEVVNRLQWLTAEVERRRKGKDSQTPKIVLVIENLPALLSTDNPAIRRMLVKLAQQGREHGIHLIVTTRSAAAKAIGPGMITNFPLRIVGAVAIKDEARFATGLTDSGAEAINQPGRFMLVQQQETIPFNSIWMNKSDLFTAVKQILSQPRRP